jgi:predicted ArsR family transcriptional regulator
VSATKTIIDFITQQDQPVTLKQLHDALGIKQSSLSGFVANLCRAGKLARERTQRDGNGRGPKIQWCYKVVAQTQQNEA